MNGETPPADSALDAIDAIARGLGTALGDTAAIKATLHGAHGRVGMQTDVELLKSDVRHGDERVTEMRELFGSMYRQLDGKLDAVHTAVRALTHRTLHPLVTALVVVCIVVVTVSAVAVAGVALHACNTMDRGARDSER